MINIIENINLNLPLNCLKLILNNLTLIKRINFMGFFLWAICGNLGF